MPRLPACPPAANPPVSSRNYFTASATVPEHSSAGTAVATLLAYHKDPWQAALLRYSVIPNGPYSAFFAVDSVAGAVTVAAPGSAGSFFNDQRTYSVVVQARDVQSNLTGVVLLTVAVIDTNDPPVAVGAYDHRSAPVVASTADR